MSDVMAHRGPDDAGVHVEDGVGFAHRRLSIIDLSDAGHQPMVSADNALAIVFNGEIYNYRELMDTLRGLGHEFESHSDTEVILHAYQEWGTRCVTYFNGMWSFALWDARRGRLFCSRDRFGEKPFYYAHLGERLVFASEIKAVLAAGIEARPNMDYLAHAVVDVALDDSDETYFLGIDQLRPAHSMVFERGRVRTFRYWDYEHERVMDTYDFSDPVRGVRELLEDSVRLRIVASDVQVGSCLSGGMDSSSIVALASGLFGVPMATFSVAYRDPGFDERRYAELVAKTFDCDSTFIEPGPEEFFSVMSRMAWFQDEPSLGPGLYSQWHAMQLAQPRVKVVLDGQGGDELMAGYRNYLDFHLRSLLGGAARGHHGDLSAFFAALPPAARTWDLPLPLAIARAAAGPKARDLYRTLTGTRTDHDISSDVIELAASRPALERSSGKTGDALNDLLYDDITRDHMPGLLHYEDRNSMAFSVEARTPFLDYRLVEYSLGVPGALKVAGGHTKSLLRSAMAGITPAEVLGREDKMGYSTPAGTWFRGPLSEAVGDILLSGTTRSRGILNMKVVEHKLKAHGSGQLDQSWQIYRWLSLEQWFRTFIDARDPRLGPVTYRAGEPR